MNPSLSAAVAIPLSTDRPGRSRVYAWAVFALTFGLMRALTAAAFFILASRTYEADAARNKTGGQFQ